MTTLDPDGYRELVGLAQDLPFQKWRTDPEDPRYVQLFGGMVRALGQRHDGHADLESVDMALVRTWGEAAGSERLRQQTREASRAPHPNGSYEAAVPGMMPAS